jgi:hypothetical protein
MRLAGKLGLPMRREDEMTTDHRNEAERLLNTAMDHIAGTHEQPLDPRAWEHLLIYCPLEILEAAYVKKAQRTEPSPAEQRTPAHG